MNNKLAIATVIIAIIIGAGIYYLTLPAPTPEVPPKILSHTIYITEADSIRFFTVVGEVQNNLKANIGSVKILATFYDAKNNTIGTRFTYTELNILKPGQKAPFDIYLLLNLSTDIPARYELTLSYVETGEEPVAELEILNRTSSIDEQGYHKISGEVQNKGLRKTYAVKIICTYYDPEGKVIAVSHAYVSPKIEAGEKASFELSSKPHKISPASYGLTIVARYGILVIAHLELLAILIAAFIIFIVFMKRRGW